MNHYDPKTLEARCANFRVSRAGNISFYLKMQVRGGVGHRVGLRGFSMGLEWGYGVWAYG